MNVTDKIKSLSLEERAGQLVMSSFSGQWEVPENTLNLLEQGAIGSILYFSGCNVVDSIQLRDLTIKVLNAAKKSKAKIKPFIAIDQEGGQLAPITKEFAIGPGNMALGAIRENGIVSAYKMGKSTGEELASIGINTCFAPVVDLCFEEGLPVKDNRYFGSNPKQTAALAAAFTKGLQEAGIIACAKHFPGQRNVDIDSHFELDVVPHSFEQLSSREWIPFKKTIEADIGMMMTLHASFPKLDPSNTPATLSPVILQEYLRKELEFKGLIVTDDIQMKPIKDKYGIQGALIKAINAGVNQIIVSGGVDNANIIIADAVRSGDISEETLNAACEKVLEYKEKYHISFEEKHFSETAVGSPVKKEHMDSIQEAADSSITLIKNQEQLLPFGTKNTKKRLAILRPTYGRLMMSDNTNFYTHTFKDIFSQYFDNVSEYVYGLDPSDVEILGACDWAFMADYVIICTYNAYQHEKQIKLFNACYEYSGKEKTVAVALRSPEDLNAIPEEVKTLLLTYGVAECSIHALAKTIGGINTPSGILPVGVGMKTTTPYPAGTGLSHF
jgi:beta-N-acetylhexosaminidase